MPPIFQSTRRTRRHRQSQALEGQQEQQTPFFSKSDGLSDVQGKSQPFFQAKLAIGQPGDPYEREADAVADAVVNHRGQAPVVQRQEISTVQRESLAAPQEEKEPVQMQTIGEEEEPVQMQAEEEEEPVQMQTMGEEEEPVQMQAEEEEEPVQMQTMGEEEEPVQMQTEEEEEPFQMKADSGNSGANKHLGSRLKDTVGKGQPLPVKTRVEMENSFGVDFSQVNIHTDGEAVQLNKDLGAHAFTHGKDVYFNAGKYNPDNSSGKHLLAHELTHVVQQGKTSIRKKPEISSNVLQRDDDQSSDEAVCREESPIMPDATRLLMLDILQEEISDATESSFLIRSQLDSMNFSSDETAKLQEQLNQNRDFLIPLLEERLNLLDEEIASLHARLGSGPVCSADPDTENLSTALVRRTSEREANARQLYPLKRWQTRRNIESIEAELSDIDQKMALLPQVCDPTDPTLDLLATRKKELEAERNTLAATLTSSAQEYKQFDSRWGAIRYGKSKECTSIAEGGCGPASLAMVINYLYQEDPETLASTGQFEIVTPQHTATYAATNGRVCTGDGGTNGNTMVSNVSTGFPGFRGQKISLDQAKAQLRSGNLIIFLCKNCTGQNRSGGNKSYGGHFMVLNGVNEAGTVYNVLDSGANESKDITTITHKELKSNAQGFWTISRQ